jgi:hypothetical protein
VIKAGRPWRWGRSTTALPRVEADVVVVVARRDEGGLVTEPCLLLESEHVAPEAERTFEIGHLEVNVADRDARINPR